MNMYLAENMVLLLSSPLLTVVSLKAFGDINNSIYPLLINSKRTVQKRENAFIRRNFFNPVITR